MKFLKWKADQLELLKDNTKTDRFYSYKDKVIHWLKLENMQTELPKLYFFGRTK